MISSSSTVHHCISKMPRASQCNARNKRFDVDFTADESIWKWRSKTNLFKWQSNILQRGFPMDPIFYCTMWHKYNNFGTFIPTEILVNFCRCSTWHFPKADENFKTHKNKWSRRKMWNEASLLSLRKLNSNCLVSWFRSVLELGEDAWSSNIGIMLRPTLCPRWPGSAAAELTGQMCTFQHLAIPQFSLTPGNWLHHRIAAGIFLHCIVMQQGSSILHSGIN